MGAKVSSPAAARQDLPPVTGYYYVRSQTSGCYSVDWTLCRANALLILGLFSMPMACARLWMYVVFVLMDKLCSYIALHQGNAQPDSGAYAAYWVFFVIFAITAIVFATLTFMKPPGRRLHGYLTTAIVTTAMVAYYSMAAHGGDTSVRLYWNTSQARDVFYARYIDWFVTTPLLLLDLLLLSAVPVGTVLWVIVADIFMIVLGLMGALSNYGYRWGWFAIGCIFQVLIVAGLLLTGMRSAYARSNELGRLYTVLSMFILVLWWGYPVVWGLAEGSNTISIKAEVACYGCLDVLTKCVFGYILMSSYSIIERVENAEVAEGKMTGNILSAPIQAPLGAIFGSSKPAARTVPMSGPPAQSVPVATLDERRVGTNNV